MFKRVEKRQRKKEEEAEMGLDEDMKEVLGMQDTDSDESDSDSDSGDSSSSTKEKQRSAVTDESEDDGEDALDEEHGEEIEESEDEGEGDEPAMSVEETLHNPLFVVSLDPEAKRCIVCPNKLLKNSKMENVHKTSNAHQRRFRRFVELARNASLEDNAWDILHKADGAKPSPQQGGVSKRAEKRKAKLAAVKSKRQMQKMMKAKAKAKKEAQAATASSPAQADKPTPGADEPTKKKRKLDSSTGETRRQPAPAKLRRPSSMDQTMQPPRKEPKPTVSQFDHNSDGKRTKRRHEAKSNAKSPGKSKRRRSDGDVLKIID